MSSLLINEKLLQPAKLKQKSHLTSSSVTTQLTSQTHGSMTTTTTKTRTLFNKLSSTSTSSTTSSISSSLSYINSAFNTNDLLSTPTVNPFEETNKFRLEQSVLSPNLFHVANTSTPERDTGCLWNIDQRAVLYPADIPTDESSLIAQYIYDNRMSKQVSAAVEAFWTQNQIIIESPLATNSVGGTCSSNPLKNRFGIPGSNSSSSKKQGSSHRNTNSKKSSLSVNSPLSYEIKTNFSSNSGSNPNRVANGSVSSTNSCSSGKNQNSFTNRANQKDQTCQTMLSFPVDFDLSKIPGLKQFLNDENESPQKKHDHHKQLNNSIRKKLFDQNSDDLSTTTTTTTATQSTQNDNAITSPNQHHDLPRPDLPSSSSNDDWDESFEFEDHRASSPKNNKILFDFGDLNQEDQNDDSVFEISGQKNNKHMHAPDLSPFSATPKKQANSPQDQINDMDVSNMLSNNSLFSKNLTHQHHQRYFHFDLTESASKREQNSQQKQDKAVSSPNLSPIRIEKKQSSHSKSKKSSSSSKKRHQNMTLDLNSTSSSSSTQGAKSIIFMDFGEKEDEKPRSFTKHNLSFELQSSTAAANENHLKREEIYTNHLYHDLDKSPANLKNELEQDENELINNTYQNLNSNQSLTNMQRESLTTSDLSQTNSLNMSSDLKIKNKGDNKTLLNSNETTSNTFLINQSSSLDTGYQTNLGSVCPNGSSTNSSANPSIMIMDTTNFNKTNEFKKPNCLSLAVTNRVVGDSNGENASVTSTPMSIVDDEFNFNSFNNYTDSNCVLQNGGLLISQNPVMSKNDCNQANKFKKSSSISLNSFENIQPVESSTPEKLKFSSFLSKQPKTYKSVLVPKLSNNFIQITNIHNKTSPATVTNKTQSFVKYKTVFGQKNAHAKLPFKIKNNSSQESNFECFKVYGSNSRNNLDFDDEDVQNDENQNEPDDIKMVSFTSQNVSLTNKSNSNKILKAKSNNSWDDLRHKKHEIDFSFMKESILPKKFVSPSEYAHNMIEQAKKELSATEVYLEKNVIVKRKSNTGIENNRNYKLLTDNSKIS